ncbi:MAG: F0F1 ATP synthase subunit A [Chloroflexi bacterium HGW-Chloroflexi-2]|jgi:F-type H+-transporting ATPase subunit a|nr:MAG: F0F1 ATP synthase subunit A [Chloroflexi bacterium HGW-Chloroflexi-2]
MEISPDGIIYWQSGWFKLNATIVYTWVVMALLVLFSVYVSRKLTSDPKKITRAQNILEIVVINVRNQIRDVSQQNPDRFMAFIGTLFIFIAVSNLMGVIPGFRPPTGSLSTTTALAISVFIAVPFFGIATRGFGGYLKQYLQPSAIMLPFNIIGDFSRTLALAVRLFGNVMSGTMLVAILLAIIPFVFPIIMQAFGMLTGFIQAYIFAVLAMVYIASATTIQEKKLNQAEEKEDED